MSGFGTTLRRLFCVTSTLAVLTAAVANAQSTRALLVDSRIAVDVPGRWQPSSVAYRDATELVVLRKGMAKISGTDSAQTDSTQEVEYREAQMLISTEPRTSHDDALKRLSDIASSRNEPVRFVELGGWPAMEMTFVEQEAVRGQNPGEA